MKEAFIPLHLGHRIPDSDNQPCSNLMLSPDVSSHSLYHLNSRV